MSKAIQTADLDWQSIDGIEIPVSKIFGDVYFSKDNGLLETRHVFINGNDLPERLTHLQDFEYFCVGETGFGTGLNILTLWQLWQEIRPDNHSHLHAISVEKFPLSKNDLIRALNAWPELAHLSEQLIEQYPLTIAGCHRLSFPNERFSIDLWLGDAHDVFPTMVKTAPINAWFLDGFAPACNPDMWEENVLKHIVRLSDIGTTFASFSVAGVLKRGLKQYGISISRPRGFKHKREMLKGIWLDSEIDPVIESDFLTQDAVLAVQKADENPLFKSTDRNTLDKQRQIAIIGAGIAGLSCAYAFAQRGHEVQIFDQSAPLSGASGNPLALLNPKLCPVEQSAAHLMTLSWQQAIRHYQNFRAFQPIAVQQIAQKNPDELFSLKQQYPEHILAIQHATDSALETTCDSLNLNIAGVVRPKVFAEEVLAHPNIQFIQAQVTDFKTLDNDSVQLISDTEIKQHFDHVIICCARDSKQFFEEFPVLKSIRGQVSWLNNANQVLDRQQAYSYGGYCMQLDAEQLILGASFYPGRDDVDVHSEDHQHNLDLLADVFPQYAKQLAPIEQWQGRASIRAQSLDYFPLLGKVQDHREIYTFSGLGSKGFLYAPLCSEVLVADVLKQACPIPNELYQKLSPKRFQKKVKAKKPYFKPH